MRTDGPGMLLARGFRARSRTASLLVVAVMGRRRGVEIFPTSQSQLWLVADDSNFPKKQKTNKQGKGAF